MRRAEFLRLATLLAASCRGRSRARARELAVTTVPRGVELPEVWELNGVIGTGQSLSVGAEGRPLRATSQSYRNLKLDLGGGLSPANKFDDPRLSLAPLCEPIRSLAWRYPGPYPRNVFGETPHTAMASQVTALFLELTAGRGDYVSVHSVVGESGQGLGIIAKGAERTADTGAAYAASLFETRAIARLARAAGRSFGVAAVVLTHGESDAQNPSYAEGVLQLARDYDADLRAITGQSRAVPLLASQQCSCPTEAGELSLSALSLVDASARAPELVVCTGPRYQYSYAPDGVHLDALGYDRLGEKYGQVYFERAVRGVDWRPLAPRAVTREGNLIEVEFQVPVPPLTWAESGGEPERAPRPEWARARGFELSAGGSPLVIEDVTLTSTRAQIRFAGRPGGPLVLRYALSAARAPGPGRSFRGGALRDSDPFVGAVTKLPQPNYALAFERSLG